MKLVIGVDENLICEGFVRNFTEEEKDVLISAVRNGTPYEERPIGEWIPVTEKLPEDDEDVLVTRVYTGSTHSFIDMVWFNKGKFLTQDGELELSNVVAWMPLPEPYKRGDV